MARGYMCDYGNCQETQIAIVLTEVGNGKIEDRRRFCSFWHAGRYALNKSARLRQVGPDATVAALKQAEES